MQTKKAIFLDIDRTLLDNNKCIPKSNYDAIHKAIDFGHTVVINTGRPVGGSMSVVQALGFNRPGCYMLSCNGCILYDCNKNEILRMRCIDPDQAVRVMRAAMDEGIHCHTYDEERIICPGPRDNELDQYRKTINIPFVCDVPLDDMHSFNMQKVMLVDLEGQQRMDIFRQAHPEFNDYFQNFFSAPILLEYVQKGVNKGTGVSMFCEFFGIDIKDTIAMGDEENDIDMIRATGWGVAMKNAKEIVKNAADEVTTLDNNEGGVAEIINKYML